jgi:adenosylhomocysteine nucleosidase
MIAVTFALPVEGSEFLGLVRNKSGNERNGVRIIRGTIDDRQIELLHTGVGEKVCHERLGKFLRGQQFDFLISAGFAGALSDELQVGDLLLAKNFSTVQLSENSSSLSELPIHMADLITVAALIDSSEERNELGRTSGAAAVDMETEFIARTCAAHGVPLLSLRVISDTPRDAFPAPSHVLFDVVKERTDPLKFVTFFLTHPNRLLALVRFARRIRRARRTLANALAQLVQKIDPGRAIEPNRPDIR